MQQIGYAVKVGFKSMRILHLVVIASGVLFALSNDTWIRLPSIFTFMIAAPFATGITSGRQVDVVLTMFGRGKIEWIDMPELQKLAEEMKVKLNSKKPFGLTDRKVYAYSNMATRSIIFERTFIKKISPENLRATAAHELTHIKKGHSNKIFFVGLPVLVGLAFLTLGAPPIVSMLVCLSGMLLIVGIISRQNEYAADIGAAIAVGKKPLIETLNIIGQDKGMDRDSDTHPSPRKRITRIMKLP